MPQEPAITFACCVESGFLESQTVRMVDSLRRYGGKFAKAAVVAVNPRFGPPISKKTRESFDKLEVTYVHRNLNNGKYSWFNFLNKPLALVAAEEASSSEVMGFLDGDLLFVDEPSQLTLAPSEDFLAFPVEIKEMGTTGPGDPYEPLWQEFCRIAGIDIQDLPWVVTAELNQRVRIYFNGGLFVYRRSAGLSKSYLDICLRLLESQVGTTAPGYGEGIKEMIALGFSVVSLGLKWRALPYSHNYAMVSVSPDFPYKEELLRQAKIVHYHDAMWPHFFSTFQKRILDTHPEVGKWLTSLGPLQNDAPLPNKLVNRLLKKVRKRQAVAYRRSCTMV